MSFEIESAILVEMPAIAVTDNLFDNRNLAQNPSFVGGACWSWLVVAELRFCVRESQARYFGSAPLSRLIFNFQIFSARNESVSRENWQMIPDNSKLHKHISETKYAPPVSVRVY